MDWQTIIITILTSSALSSMVTSAIKEYYSKDKTSAEASTLYLNGQITLSEAMEKRAINAIKEVDSLRKEYALLFDSEVKLKKELAKLENNYVILKERFDYLDKQFELQKRQNEALSKRNEELYRQNGYLLDKISKLEKEYVSKVGLFGFSDSRYRKAILDNSPIPIIYTTKEGVIYYANNRFVEMVKYGRETIIGSNITDYFDIDSNIYENNEDYKNIKAPGIVFDGDVLITINKIVAANGITECVVTFVKENE
jgi:PAS domain-containing protein